MYADLESVAKKLMRKKFLEKKWQKNGFFYSMQKFSAYNFFWVNFLHLFQRIELSIEFYV
jgi:hypothetical protein